jgi:DNA-directed RNA polymerase subunit H (RpoH/RPB5)
MAYLPKNRYESLYTNGEEYRLESTGRPYKGDYILTSAGVAYAGLNPQSIIGKLILINEKPNNINNFPINNRVYSALNPQIANKQNNYITIPQNQPSPTAIDYANGYFNRYIVTRINSKSYFEVSKDVFENFKKRNYNRDLHKIFSIRWSLKENNEEENLKTLRVYESKLPGIANFFPYKNQYALKRGVVNITPKSRIYPTGEFIPKSLPAAYQIGNNKINSIDNPNVPNLQYCGNCIFHQQGYCNRWQANIRHNYWCAVWQGLGSQE